LYGERLQLDIDNTMYDIAAHLVEIFHASKQYESFKLEALRLFGIDTNIDHNRFLTAKEQDIIHALYDEVAGGYNHRMSALKQQALPVITNIFNGNQGYQNIAIPLSDGRKNLQIAVNMSKAIETQGKEIVSAIERSITLAIIDLYWKEHLRAMDDLRHNVQFASHEQKDPLLIYKLESYDLFKQVLSRINGEIIQFLLTCKIVDNTPPQRAVQSAPQPRVSTSKAEVQNLSSRSNEGAIEQSAPVKTEPLKADPKIGRNDPCPCGSGKKYKSCHGKEGL
jgi:preprotein translocase subunit SecA